MGKDNRHRTASRIAVLDPLHPFPFPSLLLQHLNPSFRFPLPSLAYLTPTQVAPLNPLPPPPLPPALPRSHHSHPPRSCWRS